MSVYFARDSQNRVKIGTARDVEARLRALETALPETLQLLRVVDGGQKTELWLHRKFAEFHIRREWFFYRPEMLTIVPPDEIPPKPKQIVRYRTTRAYLMSCEKSGLLDANMRHAFGIPEAK